jgi:polysaccharide deacetylase family protein (PEP-CTERM system associated)
MNHILLTIDVEDWFQVENFKNYIPFSSWPSYELRVEKNSHRILDLLDSITLEETGVSGQGAGVRELNVENMNAESEARVQQPETRNSKFTTRNGQRTTDNGRGDKLHATFFVLGWLAERLPGLVREIHSRGHEIASHGYNHNLCNQQSCEDLKKDLKDSKKLLEDIIGSQVYGYRAPSFAINNDILQVIEDCGYLYDSSYNSFAMHERYGRLDLSKNENKGVAVKISNNFYELPISNIKFSVQHSKSRIQNLQLPWGGGGYFRTIPLSLFKMGVNSILNKYKAYIFYMHPWEIDSKQPRIKEASCFLKFRHYVNLHKNASKFSSLIKYFRKYSFTTCHNYLKFQTQAPQLTQ